MSAKLLLEFVPPKLEDRFRRANHKSRRGERLLQRREEPTMNDVVKPDAAGLVAVMNRRIDLELAHARHWYRIPVRSAPAALDEMRWVAFYLTTPFGRDKWSVRHWASITSIDEVRRIELLPDEPDHPRANDVYYRLALGQIQQRHEPILSRRRRRVVFIPSIWRKFANALEINDLHHGSPLEDRLWAAFKQEGIDAERQWFEGAAETLFCLDFAVFCPQRNIDIECDGDRWHSNPERARQDNDRNNFLEQRGWHVLRFNTAQLTSNLPNCLQAVKNTIQRCGGHYSADGTLRPFDDGRPHRDRVFDIVEDAVPPAMKCRVLKTVPTISESKPRHADRVDIRHLLSIATAKSRREVLAKLESAHGAEAVATAISAALSGLTPQEKERGLWTLGELRPNSAAVDCLVACIPLEARRNTRRLAYSACAKLRSQQFEGPILGRLHEEEQQVLQYAIHALAECGTRLAIESLRQVLSRPQPEYVIKAANQALRRCALRKITSE